MEQKVRLTPPWVEYYYELASLFGKDPEIKISYDESKYEVKMYVNNHQKADAIATLLPTEKSFGNDKLKITVIPNNEEELNKAELLRVALEGNPNFSYCEMVDTFFSNPFYYFVFKNEVVQYYNDDLGDAHGVRSTLYQEIAKEIFGESNGIFFCTDITDSSVVTPLDEN